ncbi:MAG TPA: hypothetical protein VNH46_05625, partial [Gemmatimonadales bacterium]|nr:hypothetical protein [Gemmatimonadales bacterium]
MREICSPKARPGRLVHSLGAFLTALFLTTCSDNPTGPDRAGLATLRVAPVFDAYARVAPLVLDNVRVIVVRPPADTAAVASRSVAAGTNQLQLGVTVPLRSSSEDLQVTLELYAGTTLLFSGTSTVHVTAGAPGSPQTVPVTYRGPGAQATAITVAPRDTTLSFGATFPFQASATDAQGQPVAQFYVSWSLPGAPTGVTVDATGSITAPSARDTFFVKAVTPNGLADSTRVFIAA